MSVGLVERRSPSPAVSRDRFAASDYVPDYERSFANGKKFLDVGPSGYRKYVPRVYDSGIVCLQPIADASLGPPTQQQLDLGCLGADVLALDNTYTSDNAQLDVGVEVSEDGLRLVAPEYKSRATLRFCVDLARAANRAWTVGFITACLEYELLATFANGGCFEYRLPHYGVRALDAGAGGVAEADAPFGGGRSSSDLERNWQQAMHSDTVVECVVDRRSPTVPVDFYAGIEQLRPPRQARDSSALLSVRWRQTYRTWLAAKFHGNGAVYALLPARWTVDLTYDCSRRRYDHVHASTDLERDNYYVPEVAVDSAAGVLSDGILTRRRTHPAWTAPLHEHSPAAVRTDNRQLPPPPPPSPPKHSHSLMTDNYRSPLPPPPPPKGSAPASANHLSPPTPPIKHDSPAKPDNHPRPPPPPLLLPQHGWPLRMDDHSHAACASEKGSRECTGNCGLSSATPQR